MLNQLVLVGRLAKDIKLNKEETIITLAVNRSYKNEEGVYETDFINILIRGSIAENTAEFCKTGDIIGIKGRVETMNEQMVLVGEKITFLTSKKETQYA